MRSSGFLQVQHIMTLNRINVQYMKQQCPKFDRLHISAKACKSKTYCKIHRNVCTSFPIQILRQLADKYPLRTCIC